ncbi:MAG: exodeoxyribonuclease VII large subunit [Desulfobacteraceae bacterium IS3]|nr:MAG: exodeoxyribonuclease VII large subunit [Desulfobacteraceae bacterium IS3]
MNREIYSISELTADIKNLLEENFPFVWVSGEISNFHTPISGHFYFTLKDENTQIRAVMFRGQNRSLKFKPQDGMQITGLGRITVYEPRGNYQIIFEYLEPKGIGALQAGFEQLKARLSQEGLFDPQHKKPLPFMPKKISVITSPTGAVIRDILTVIDRRFPDIHIEIIPVKVQGDTAAKEIVSAIELLNRRKDADVAILARGGGSLEDLQSFNSEKVARAIFASEIPIISAVGHETDFTIADFTADLRAPTPSAAAEMAVPLKHELAGKCTRLSSALKNCFYRYMEHRRKRLKEISAKLLYPMKRIQQSGLKNDELSQRLIRVFVSSIRRKREEISWRVARLQSLSPLAILARGYSITRTVPEHIAVTDSDAVTHGQQLEIMLAKGSLLCRAEGKK